MEELSKSLQSLLTSEEDCDVVIRVKGKEFRAHRSILRARSPVFRAMFSHDMLEKQRGVVTMEDCDPDAFPDFLDHVYSGNTKMISAKNVVLLFEAADKYDFATLRNECAKFLRKNLSISCFCDVITFAIRHNDRVLTELATEFFCNNSVDILERAEWQVFLSENPIVGNELFLKLLSKHGNIFRASR